MYFFDNNILPPQIYPRSCHSRGQSWSYMPYTFPVYNPYQNPYPFYPVIRRYRVVERRPNNNTHIAKPSMLTKIPIPKSARNTVQAKNVSKIPAPTMRLSNFCNRHMFAKKQIPNNFVEHNGSLSFILKKSHRRSYSYGDIRNRSFNERCANVIEGQGHEFSLTNFEKNVEELNKNMKEKTNKNSIILVDSITFNANIDTKKNNKNFKTHRRSLSRDNNSVYISKNEENKKNVRKHRKSINKKNNSMYTSINNNDVNVNYNGNYYSSYNDDSNKRIKQVNLCKDNINFSKSYKKNIENKENISQNDNENCHHLKMYYNISGLKENINYLNNGEGKSLIPCGNNGN